MAKTNKLSARKKDERAAAYIFTIPAIALLVAFLVVPMVYTVYYSVFKYQVMRPNDITFIGLANYQKLFKDPEFWKALRNTFYFTIIVVPVQCVLALALALLVSKRFRGVSIFRTMYFSPQLTSMVVISVLWTVLYNSNPNTWLTADQLPDQRQDSDERDHLYVCLAGRGLPDDDFPGRSAGYSHGAVRGFSS